MQTNLTLLVGILAVVTVSLSAACGSGTSDQEKARERAFDYASEEIGFTLFVPTDLPKGMDDAELTVRLLRDLGEDGLPTDPHRVELIYLATDGEAVIRIREARSTSSRILGTLEIWEISGVSVYVRDDQDVLLAEYFDQDLYVGVEFYRGGDFEIDRMLVEMRATVESMLE